MISNLLVAFYRFWHGTLRLAGAGLTLRSMAPFLGGLQRHKLRIPNGEEIEVDFRDITAFYWLNYTLGDAYEEDGLLLALPRCLKAEGVFWDIGANAGLLSYRIASQRPSKEHHLFEPNPRMYAIAVAALRTYPFAKAHQLALSDKEAMVELTIPEGESPIGTLEAGKTQRQGHKIEVQCYAGDKLVFEQGYAPPTVIKIDTEGHEPHVLAGLKGVIDTYKPTVFFEHLSMTDAEVTACIPNGYSIFTVRNSDGTLVAGFDRSQGHNSALIPK